MDSQAPGRPGGMRLDLGFFDSLYRDPEFCDVLGKVTLAAGRFESDLRAYLRIRGIRVSDQETLGPLIAHLEKHAMLSENGVRILRQLKLQRNYLTHSLFDLFSDRIEETVLPREGLIPSDVWTYTEKAWELEQNLSGLTRIVEDAIARVKKMVSQGVALDGELLLRP